MPAVISSDAVTRTLLVPGRNCWRVAEASRAALLIDGQAYFTALRSALLQAQTQVLIAGWDFDSRILLPRSPHETGDAPEELAQLLGYLVRERGVDVHVSRWAYHWWYSDDRERHTQARLAAVGVRFYEDPVHAMTGCVHHKVVSIDDALAFCGGIDLTHERWDTCEHGCVEPRRATCTGKLYMPVHDTQLCVTGDAARALADYVRASWPSSEPQLTPVRPPAANPWPQGLQPDFENVRLGIARTISPTPDRDAVREIEQLYLAAIARTRRSLYIENQYFTSTRIAKAITKQCRKHAGLQGLLVGLEQPKTPTERHIMGYGRGAFGRQLAQLQLLERVPMVAAISGESAINVHSKLAIFDDDWLTVGSANLNRRSMGFDTECNVIIEATTAEHRAAMARLRSTLIAEHVGASIEAVQQASAMGLASLPSLSQGPRRLIHIDPEMKAPTLGPLLTPIFDPDVRRAPHSLQRRGARLPLARQAAVALVCIGLLAAAGVSAEQDNSWLRNMEQMFEQLLRG